MEEENELVCYMKKLQNMADYLARGGILVSPNEYTAIEIVDDALTKQRNAFAIQEYDLYDILEVSYFGEQKSIGILMECIDDGEYERQVEGKIDFNAPYHPAPDDAEEYKRVMKRVKAILRMMALFLASGSHIPLEDYEFKGLKEIYIEEDELDNYEEVMSGYIVYDTQKQCFCAMSAEGDTVIENIEIEVAMGFYNNFLVRQEQDELYKKAMRAVQSNDKKEKTDQEERE